MANCGIKGKTSQAVRWALVKERSSLTEMDAQPDALSGSRELSESGLPRHDSASIMAFSLRRSDRQPKTFWSGSSSEARYTSFGIRVEYHLECSEEHLGAWHPDPALFLQTGDFALGDLRSTSFARRGTRAGGAMRNSFLHAVAVDRATALLCDRLCRTWASRCGVSIDTLRAIIRPELTQSIGAGHTWCANGQGYKAPLIALSGWACEQRILECGRRQIFSFLIAGDLLSRTKADIVSLTPMILLDASELASAAAEGGPLAALLQDLLLQRTHYIYDHVVRLGTQNAVDRAYDLLHEMFMRLRQCAPPFAASVAFPVTQEVLADMLGMSPVHVNRVLQQMRREGTVALGHGRLTVYPRDLAMTKSA